MHDFLHVIWNIRKTSFQAFNTKTEGRVVLTGENRFINLNPMTPRIGETSNLDIKAVGRRSGKVGARFVILVRQAIGNRQRSRQGHFH